MTIFFSDTGPSGVNHASPHDAGASFASICRPTVKAYSGDRGVYEIMHPSMEQSWSGRIWSRKRSELNRPQVGVVRANVSQNVTPWLSG